MRFFSTPFIEPLRRWVCNGAGRRGNRAFRTSVVSGALISASLLMLACTDFGSGPAPVHSGDHGGGNDTTTVSFAAQILPVFEARCGGTRCHLPCGSSNGNGLCLVSYRSLMRSHVVLPGDAENSLLVQYLDGRKSPLMPYGKRPLSDSMIQTIRTWIDEGAREN